MARSLDKREISLFLCGSAGSGGSGGLQVPPSAVPHFRVTPTTKYLQGYYKCMLCMAHIYKSNRNGRYIGMPFKA